MYEPLDLIASDDPVPFAEYAKQNKLLDIPGWKIFRRYSKYDKEMHHIIIQSKMKHFRRDPFHKFGILVPHTHLQALELDKSNGNPKWYEAEDIEMKQLLEYNTFFDQGKGGIAPATRRFDAIRKHDGRHKARLVAG
jgi:hypothetical protein